MFGNPALTQAFGVTWTLSKCFMVVGIVLIAIASGVFVILFKHTKGRGRRLEPQEAGYVAVYSASRDYEARPISSSGAGYGVELTVNIDTLRNAAKRGDWLSFPSWPVMLSCAFIGMGLSMASALIYFDVPSFAWWMLTVLVFLMVAVAVFMPWAAIYTKIDLGADTPTTNQPEPNK